MKFTCEKALLLDAITDASHAASGKSSIAALEGLLIEAGEGNVHFVGYNLETGIRTLVPAEVAEKGGIVLSSRMFCDIVRKLEDAPVTLESKDLTVEIRCGAALFKLQGSDPEEFPELPSVDCQNSITLKQSQLRDVIGGVIFSVATTEERPVFTGALFECSDEGLTAVAVDGFRLALRRSELLKKEGEDAFSFVVPGAALREVQRICGDSEEEVSVLQGTRHILFRMGDTELITRRLEGEFLNYRNAIPQTSTISLLADRSSLLASIDRVSLMVSEKLKSPLRCVFGDGKLVITTKTAIGNGYDECPIQGDGKGLEIGFNNHYLFEAVQACPTDEIRLEMNNAIAPCLLLPPEGKQDYLYMVLPVRLKAGE